MESEPEQQPSTTGYRKRYKFFNNLRQTQKLKAAKKTAYKTKIPNTVLEMYKKLNIFDIENNDDRAIMIVKYLASKQYRLQTALKYFEFVRRDGVIGDSQISLNKRMFDKITAPQERIPSIGMFKNLIEFFQNIISNDENKIKMDYNQYVSVKLRKVNLTYAVLFVYYTGLRSFEVCSITNKILHELLNYEMVISLERKSSDKWNVVYSRQFQKFLQLMKIFYADYLELYETKNIIVKIFNVSTNYLHFFLVQNYILVNKEEPPIGFGLHSIRYIIATSLAQNNNLEAAKIFLGHSDVKTTHVYLKYHQIHPNNRLREFALKDPFLCEISKTLAK